MTGEVGETMLHSPLLLLRAESEFSRFEVAQARASLEQAIEIARQQGAALFELQALDCARRHGLPEEHGGRFQSLLALYADDPSPVIAEIRMRPG